MPKEQIIESYFEQIAAARKEFDGFDAELNGSVMKIMSAYAALAEQKPEELFGLKPTERDKYFANKLLDKNVLNAAASNSGDVMNSGDVTGSNPLSVAAIAEALASILGSEGGAKVVEELLHHVREEKNFFKKTGADITEWIFGD